MQRRVLYGAPFVAALVVGLALVGTGGRRLVRAARVYGGATEGTTRVSLRVVVVDTDGEIEAPVLAGVPVSLTLDAGGSSLGQNGTTDDDGAWDVALDLPAPLAAPPSLELRSAGARLGAGPIWLDRAAWWSRAQKRGAQVQETLPGGIDISFAPERGALAVGFFDPIVIALRRAGGSLAGVELALTGEGATLNAARGRTGADGGFHCELRADEANASLRVKAEVGDQKIAWAVHVGAVPSALRVSPAGARFKVEAATPRTRAYYALLDDHTRLAGGSVALPSSGALEAFITVPAGLAPRWILVSGEPGFDALSTVGWPVAPGAVPVDSVAIADVLLLDGRRGVLARERARARRARWLALSIVFVAAAVTALLVVRDAREAEARLGAHLQSASDDPDALLPKNTLGLRIAVAVAAVLLGFGLLAAIVAIR